ncbi:MAG: hypothetical protein FWD42_09665 [Solirubrobacterales bacterium]|nr:hypothetical protein [Solirubrobacterales bacterium]
MSLPETLFFFGMWIFLPLTLLAWAMISSRLQRGRGNADILDWRPTRSPQREAALEEHDVEEMLAAQNRYRRMRGEPERTLEEILDSPWAALQSGSPRSRSGSGSAGSAAR